MNKIKKIVIYVEGPSDKAGLETLLEGVISSAENKGVTIEIVHPSKSDRQKTLIFNYPSKAVIALQNNPKLIIFIIPDLHPMNRFGLSYTTSEQLQRIIKDAGHNKSSEPVTMTRFYTHCFVHEFEVLLMASNIPEKNLHPTYNWDEPERQNGQLPPKEIIKKMYPNYQGRSDGPRLLKQYGSVDLISTKCPYFSKFIIELNVAIDKELP